MLALLCHPHHHYLNLQAGPSNLQCLCECHLVLLYLRPAATLTLLKAPRTLRCSSQISNQQGAWLRWPAIPSIDRGSNLDGSCCNADKLLHRGTSRPNVFALCFMLRLEFGLLLLEWQRRRLWESCGKFHHCFIIGLYECLNSLQIFAIASLLAFMSASIHFEYFFRKLRN